MKPKIYIRDFNNVMSGIKKCEDFEFVEDPRDSDCLVLWQDVRSEMLELCKINREYMKKPVVVVQHGTGGTRDYQPPEKFEMYADKFCCWGTHDYDRLVNNGYGDRAVLTGSTLINQLKPLVPHTDKNIIFCPIVNMHEEPANLITFYELKKIELDYSQKKLLKHKEDLRDRWDARILCPDAPEGLTIPYSDINTNFRLISKLTTMHDKSLYLGSITLTHVQSATHLEDSVKLLTQTDLVVGMVEGTFQMLAMAMGIPVVVCKGWEFKEYAGKDYSSSEMIFTNGVVRCEVEDLRKTIEQELSNPTRLAEERQKTLLGEFGDINSDPDSKIIETIKGVLNG